MNPILARYNRPVFFYFWSIVIPWFCWFLAGYISRLPQAADYAWLQGTLGIAGLLAPIAVAAWLFAADPVLLVDLKARLFTRRGLNWRVLSFTLLFPPLSIIFAFFWVAWHLPLASIKGYYQANLVAEGWQYGVNFIVSVFMFVFIMNWLYAKAGRNVWIAVLFHAVANLSNEIFATHPDSKIIQSGLFLLLAAYFLIHDRKLFFQRGSVA